MKKRCTNSACRRVFPLRRDVEVTCPYCGKKYPRMMSCSRFQLVYTGLADPGQRVAAIKLIHRLVEGINLGEARWLVMNPPAVLLDDLTADQLEEVKARLDPNVCTFRVRAAGTGRDAREDGGYTYRLVLADFDRRQEKKLVRLVQKLFNCSAEKAKVRLHHPHFMTLSYVSRCEAEAVQRRLENAGAKVNVERIGSYTAERRRLGLFLEGEH